MAEGQGTGEGTPSSVHIDSYGMSASARNKLKDSDFAIPSERRYPIHDISHARNALARSSGKPEEDTVRKAVTRRYPQLKKTELDFEIMLKADAQHLVYGVLLEPDLVDSQGDEISPEEIQKAAHDYLVNSRQTDVQHNETPAAVDVVESYIAQHDFELAGQPVTKGSWVIVHKVHDEDVWEQIVAGELTGLSIGGTAVRSEA